jgi:hypothetical protein
MTHLERLDRMFATEVRNEERSQAMRELTAKIMAALPQRVELIVNNHGRSTFTGRVPRRVGPW